MEVTLSQLADRWNNVVWGMDPYKGGDVPLLKIAEEDFEALEVLLTYTSEMKTIQFALSWLWARWQKAIATRLKSKTHPNVCLKQLYYLRPRYLWTRCTNTRCLVCRVLCCNPFFRRTSS